MGEIYLGEFGIPNDTAAIDTIGVHPDVQRSGVAHMLLDEYKTSARAAGVKRLHSKKDICPPLRICPCHFAVSILVIQRIAAKISAPPIQVQMSGNSPKTTNPNNAANTSRVNSKGSTTVASAAA